MTTTLKLTPSESVSVRSNRPEALEVEATYGPGGSAPPKHFEVLEGAMRARVDGDERVLGRPPDVEPRRDAQVRSVDALIREGRVASNGMQGPNPSCRRPSRCWRRSAA